MVKRGELRGEVACILGLRVVPEAAVPNEAFERISPRGNAPVGEDIPSREAVGSLHSEKRKVPEKILPDQH